MKKVAEVRQNVIQYNIIKVGRAAIFEYQSNGINNCIRKMISSRGLRFV